MGTSSQFHDGAQLKFNPNVAQRDTIHFWIGFKKPFSKPGPPF